MDKKNKIFKKIETNGDPFKEVLVKIYKHETILAIGVLIACSIGMILISKFAGYGIIFNILIFSKYLYDRRIKLNKDLDKN